MKVRGKLKGSLEKNNNNKNGQVLNKPQMRLLLKISGGTFYQIQTNVHSKNSNHLRYHIQEPVCSRAIMALDHSRLVKSRKQNLGKQIRPDFFAFDRFTLQILANKSGDV